MIKNHTKENVLIAFNELLKSQPFEKITVEEICLKSEISRSTFYRNFIDKFDVMNYNYKKLIEDIFEFELCNCWRDLIVVILANSKKNYIRFVNAFEYAGANSYPNYLANYSLNLIKETAKIVRGKPIDEQEYSVCSVFCYGLTWTIYDWVKGRINLPIDEVATELDKSVPNSIRDLWDIKRYNVFNVLEKIQ